MTGEERLRCIDALYQDFALRATAPEATARQLAEAIFALAESVPSLVIAHTKMVVALHRIVECSDHWTALMIAERALKEADE